MLNPSPGGNEDTSKKTIFSKTFVPSPLWPDSYWRKAGNVSVPVIVSAVQSGHAEEAVDFLRYTKAFLPNTTIILFDLGLSSQELLIVKEECENQNDNYTLATDIPREIEKDFLRPKRKNTILKSGKVFEQNQISDTNISINSPNAKFNNQKEDTLTTSDTFVCQIRLFDPEALLPSHTHRLSNRAFRPLIIQTVLKDAGCVLWIDLSQRLVNNDTSTFLQFALRNDAKSNEKNLKENTDNIENKMKIEEAEITKEGGYGITAWKMEENRPTTSQTHPNMFGRLHVWPLKDANEKNDVEMISHNSDSIIESYRFQHMVDMRALLLYNTQNVRDELMIPWVKCALTSDCIEPIGAQGT